MDYVPQHTPDSTVWRSVDELAPEERSALASHRNAVQRALGGDGDALAPFEGTLIGGLPLATDMDDVRELDKRGDTRYDDFYWDGKTWRDT